MPRQEITHAVIRFQEPDKRVTHYVTKTSNIERFRPQFAQDFDRERKYEVRWQPSFDGPTEHRSGKWEGHILVLGVSEEEVILKFKRDYPRVKITGHIPDSFPTQSQPESDKRRRKARCNTHGESQPSSSTATSQSTKANGVRNSPSQASQGGSLQKKSTGGSKQGKCSSPAPGSNTASLPQPRSHEQGESSSAELRELERQSALIMLQMERIRKQQASASASTIAAPNPRATPETQQKEDVQNDENFFEDIDDSNLEGREHEENGNGSPGPGENQTPPRETEEGADEPLSDEPLSDEEATVNRIYKDLKGEELLEVDEKNKVYIGRKCFMKHKFYELKVRSASDNSKFVRLMAQGLWGRKKCSRRTLTGKSRGAVEKKKATPRKVDCVMAAFKGYMKFKAIEPACHDTLLKQARRDLQDKLGDAGRENDPQYRSKVKKWNAAAKTRRQAKRQVAEPPSSASDSD